MTSVDTNTYLSEAKYPNLMAMTPAEKEKKEFSDEELEDIMTKRAEEQISVREIRETIRDSPLLTTGLAFAFGLLVGVSLCSGRRRSS